MRIIKLGIISLLFFALMITLISLFFPSRVRISRATDIPAGQQELMARLNNTNSWKNWYPGADSAKVLPEITAVTDSSVTATSLLDNGRKGITGWNIYPSNYPGTVTLQWYMDFRLRWYPWEKFSGILLDKRYGPVMEQGLERLKKIFTKDSLPPL